MATLAEHARGGPWPRLGAVLVALGLAVFVLQASMPSTRGAATQAAACESTVVIDGALRCIPVAGVVDVCGAVHALQPGDQIDTVSCAAPSRLPGSQLAALNLPVNVNTATATELTSLPGVGPVLADRIVLGRPYASFDALLGVSGIGPVTLDAIRPRVVLAAASGDPQH